MLQRIVTEPQTKGWNLMVFYLGKAKGLELYHEHLHYFTPELQQRYIQELKGVYDILFDRAMASKMSPFFKSELEDWYSFHREWIGLSDATEMNRGMEKLLRKFDLL